MSDDLTCCCGCIIVIFIIFAGISVFGNLMSHDSTEDYTHRNNIPKDYDKIDVTDNDDIDDYDENTDDTLNSADKEDSSHSSKSSYVGSANSNKFHDPSCSQAHRIKDGNLVSFSSRDDAMNSGYSPCGVCHP